jgi:hypothetical protein
MQPVRLKLVMVGISSSLVIALRSQFPVDLVEDATDVTSPKLAVERLVEGRSNCVFLDPVAFDWRSTEDLLQLSSDTFPVCLVRSISDASVIAKIPRKWLERLSNYYFVESSASLAEFPNQVDTALRGCHRYLLKKMITGNLQEIASEAGSSALIAQKALQAESAMKEIEAQNKSELGSNLGLNSQQLKAFFDETLKDARSASKTAQGANFAVLAVGMLLLVATAGAALFEHSANPWTFATGGMGAAATIAALITSPSSRIGNSASRLIFVQVAYFSFLTQVRLLNALSPETVIERSQRLEGATAKLLEQLKSSQGE